MSVCLHIKRLSSYWMDFHDSLHWGILLKSVDIVKFYLKLDKSNRQLKRGQKKKTVLLARTQQGCRRCDVMAIESVKITELLDLKIKIKR
jgi:hypothetical protein